MLVAVLVVSMRDGTTSASEPEYAAPPSEGTAAVLTVQQAELDAPLAKEKAPQPNHPLWHKAIAAEQAGDVRRASSLYRKISFGKDRAAAAKATFALGQMYQHASASRALKYYDKYLARYADQQDAPAVMWSKAEIHRAAGQTQERIETLRTLRARYVKSSFAKKAEDLLKRTFSLIQHLGFDVGDSRPDVVR